METLLYFAFWAGLIFLMMRFGCGAHVMGHGNRKTDARSKDAPANVGPLRWVAPQTDVDPVCGKTVPTAKAKSTVHDGMVYYFCSAEHREAFETAPDSYVGLTAHHVPAQGGHAHG